MKTLTLILLCIVSSCLASPLKQDPLGISKNLGNPWLQASDEDTNVIPPSHECLGEFNTLRKEWWKGLHATSLNDFLDSRQGKMHDATGRPPANVLGSGNLEWLGSREECLGISGMQYCVMPMKVENTKQVGKFGVCFPKGCSKIDAVGFAQSVVYLYMKTVYYLAGFFFPGEHLKFDETAAQVICFSE